MLPRRHRALCAVCGNHRIPSRLLSRPYGLERTRHGGVFPVHGRTYFRIVIFGGSVGWAGSNRPKEKIAVAEAIATYCLPLTSYVTGDAVSSSPMLKCQRCLPVLASS